jgi:hypothetical protein
VYDQQQNNPRQREDGLRQMLWGLRSVAAISWVFTRRHVGSECPGAAGLGSVFIVLVAAMFADTTPAWLFLCIYSLALCRLRAEWFRNWKRGVVMHRFWDGTPWLAQRLLPRVQSISNLKGYEGFIVAFVGIALTHVDQVLGGLLIASGGATVCVEGIWVQIRKNRVGAMRDAQIEMNQLHDDYTNGVS